MICRIWHGWTTYENSTGYLTLLQNEILTGIANRQIKGYTGHQLLRRNLEKEVEFVTVLWFESMDSVREFAGQDSELAVVPPTARAILSHFDERSSHYNAFGSAKGKVMIARIWHGITPAAKAEEYLDFLKKTALPDYSQTRGNLGAFVLRSIAGDKNHFLTLSWWDALASIKKFAGANYEQAKYYPEDTEYLLEFEPTVLHYEALGQSNLN
jgi:heme-degrading monooxygenase HmoA